MRDVAVPAEFIASGGAELAPMSTTAALDVAVRYSSGASAVLLRLRI